MAEQTAYSQNTSVFDTFGLDWQVLLFNLISFLIVLYFLKRFVFDPVKKIIDERQALINEGMENMENSKTVIANANLEADSIIQKANKQANKILENVHTQESEVRKQQQMQTQEFIDSMMEKGKMDVENMKVEARQKLAKEAKEIVLDATQKILKREVDPNIVTEELDKKLSPIK